MSDASSRTATLFYFEVWFTGHADGLAPEAMQAAVTACWAGRTDRSLLVLDGRDMAMQGIMPASSSDAAFDEAIAEANDCYRQAVDREPKWSHAMVRTPAEQLDFINTDLQPFYRVPALEDPLTVMQLSAAAIMRTMGTTEAQLYLATTPNDHQ